MQISFTFLYLNKYQNKFYYYSFKISLCFRLAQIPRPILHNKLALLTKGILYGDLPFIPYIPLFAPSPRISYIFCIPPQIPTFLLPDKKIKGHLPLFIIYLLQTSQIVVKNYLNWILVRLLVSWIQSSRRFLTLFIECFIFLYLTIWQ